MKVFLLINHNQTRCNCFLMDCVYLSCMQFEKARDFIFKKLENELPSSLSYHTVQHVRDVYDCADRIGREEGVTDHDLQLLLTAAAFHDSGFIHLRTGHEEESCRIALNVLPFYHYTDDDIEKICGMIMATRLPQSPQNHLEQILADADLDYLGRDDFFTIGDKLFKELLDAGIVKDHNEWNRVQLSFMENHCYFTPTAAAQRKEKKDDNIKKVKAKLKT